MRQVHRDGHSFDVADSHDGADFWPTYYENGWEAEQGGILDLIAPAGILIDIGAWIGPWTLPAAVRGVRVEAWEPDPTAYNRLTDNVRLNRLTNVRTWNAALITGHDHELTIHAENDMWGGSNTGRWAQGTLTREVAAVNIADALTPGAFVKLDVEGDELDLFPVIADAGHPCHVSLHAPLARRAGSPANFRKALRSSFGRYRTLIVDGHHTATPDRIPYDRLVSITCLEPRR